PRRAPLFPYTTLFRSGRAARSWAAFDRILKTLARLKNDETLLVQSGKPVGVFRTHEWAPRVLIANALIVPRWATWDEFRRLEDRSEEHTSELQSLAYL